MAWRNYHENSLTDHYEIAAITIGSNNRGDKFIDQNFQQIVLDNPANFQEKLS